MDMDFVHTMATTTISASGVAAAGADLYAQARAGSGAAFRALTEPHRRELRVHCYRMLGTLQDAEDALQDTLLAAWQSLGGFEERASLRTWLYRIATNRCLNALRSARRRPAQAWNVPGVEPPDPTQLGEVAWLEPLPDASDDDAAHGLPHGATHSVSPGPEARHERAESISLAFVTALQTLPPRQTAALILCDVLEYRAEEVATMLDTTTGAVNSALKRARAGLQQRAAAAPGRRADRVAAPAPAAGSAAEVALVARFVRAYEAADVPALIALLTDDVFMSMPPIPYEYVGREPVAAFIEALFGAGRRFDLLPTRANGQPAFGAYLRRPGGGARPGVGFITLALAGDRVSALSRFESHVLPWFGLPPELPARP